jgi:hypothetical protein
LLTFSFLSFVCFLCENSVSHSILCLIVLCHSISPAPPQYQLGHGLIKWMNSSSGSTTMWWGSVEPHEFSVMLAPKPAHARVFQWLAGASHSAGGC